MADAPKQKIDKRSPKWLSLEHMELLALAQLDNQKLIAQELGVSSGRVSQMIAEIENLLGVMTGVTPFKVFARGDKGKSGQFGALSKSMLTPSGELIRKSAIEVLAKASEFNALIKTLGNERKLSDEISFAVACCGVEDQLIRVWFDLFPNSDDAVSLVRVLSGEETVSVSDHFQIVDCLLLSPKKENSYAEYTIGRSNLLVWGPKNKSGFPGCLDRELFYIPKASTVFSGVLSQYFGNVGVVPRLVENSCDKRLLRRMAVASNAFFAVRSDDQSTEEEEFVELMRDNNYRPTGICEDSVIETKVIVKDRAFGESCNETLGAYCLEYSRQFMSMFLTIERSRNGYRVVKSIPKNL